MHNNTKCKQKQLMLKPMTNERNETKSRYKKTRKMKGGGFNLFSRKKPATTVAGPISASTQPTRTTASIMTQTSAVVSGVTTLATMASEYLANPVALTALTGILSTSVALSCGGGALVLGLVAVSAWLIIKQKKKAYKGLMLVMDELYLVLQKMMGILEVSMHIAETYGFPVDTRDVSIALNSILVKFDELLEPTDLSQIKKDISNSKKLKEDFYAQASAVDEELESLRKTQDNDISPNETQKLSLFTRINNQRKQIFFNASEFIEELNEAIAYLALYFAALAASFSTTYTTVVVQLIVNEKTEDLRNLQAKMLQTNQFHSMLEGALVYPLLQSKKTHETCKLKNLKDISCDQTLLTSAKNSLSYIKGKLDNGSAVGSELYTKMTKLKTVVDTQTDISTVDQAIQFAEAVKQARDDDAYAPTAVAPTVAPTVAPNAVVPTVASLSALPLAQPPTVAPNAVAQIQTPPPQSQMPSAI